MEITNKKVWLNYSDIAIVPKRGIVKSRRDICTDFFFEEYKPFTNVSNFLFKYKFKLPVVPANMKCVIDYERAHWLSENNYFYIMHRFDIELVEMVTNMYVQDWKNISISIGFNDDDITALRIIAKLGYRIDFITVDVAHGHCNKMYEVLQKLCELRIKTPEWSGLKIIAGNVGTAEGYNDLSAWGADIIKIGIGPGAACTTKLKTGVFTPMFTLIQEVAKCRVDNNLNTFIIADGGIEHNGDIAKALVAGADMVMVGGLFAMCEDSPAESDNKGKIYFGSASAKNKGHTNNIEGGCFSIPSNGMTYKEKLLEIQQDLQSTISYIGGENLAQFNLADYIILK